MAAVAGANPELYCVRTELRPRRFADPLSIFVLRISLLRSFGRDRQHHG